MKPTDRALQYLTQLAADYAATLAPTAAAGVHALASDCVKILADAVSQKDGDVDPPN